MKKDKFITVTLISIVLFIIFFLFVFTFYNDVIILVTGNYKVYSFEYYMSLPAYTSEENIVVNITFMVKILFSLIFGLEFLYMMSSKAYREIIGKKFLVINIILGIVIYRISFLYIKYEAIHYYLYMHLISTLILGMVLLSLTIRIKKSNREISNK